MPPVDLNIAVLVDLVVFGVCSFVLISTQTLRHSHPAVIYLAFHALVISFRAHAVNGGAKTFLSGIPGLDAVSPGEIGRAVLIADIALIAATVGWVTAGRGNTNRILTTQPPDEQPPVFTYRPLQFKYILTVAAVAMPIGLFTLAKYGSLPGSPVTSISTSSYSTLAVTWPGLVLLAFIYFHGFRPALVIPLVGYLAFTAIQGFDRFRLVIPVILLCQIYLDRRGRRWPGKAMLALLAIMVLVFFPLKEIGLGVIQGQNVATIAANAETSITDALGGRNADQAVLDELAVTVSGAQETGATLWGRPYLNVLVLPVPKQWWPGKPGLADYLNTISQPRRPLAQIGGVTTLPGDLYLNFRIPGLVLCMFLLARLSGRLCYAAYRYPYLSLNRFCYLLLAVNFIQIFRDGLISVPVFLLVNMMPLMAIALLHLLGPPARVVDGDAATLKPRGSTRSSR